MYDTNACTSTTLVVITALLECRHSVTGHAACRPSALSSAKVLENDGDKTRSAGVVARLTFKTIISNLWSQNTRYICVQRGTTMAHRCCFCPQYLTIRFFATPLQCTIGSLYDHCFVAFLNSTTLTLPPSDSCSDTRTLFPMDPRHLCARNRCNSTHLSLMLYSQSQRGYT